MSRLQDPDQTPTAQQGKWPSRNRDSATTLPQPVANDTTGSRAASAALAAELQQRLSAVFEGELCFDEMSRGLYSTDASIYQLKPLGVAFPKHTADVIAAVRIAAELNVPILPRGSGTSLSGQSIGTGLILDLSREMRQILEIDPEKRLARIQPGVVLDELNAVLKPLGLQFGPDVATSSRANLGGMIGNNSAGSRSVRMGKTIDHVRSLKVVLSDGTSLHTGPMSAEELSRTTQWPDRIGTLHREFCQLIESQKREIRRRYPRLLRRVSGYNLAEFVPDLMAEMPQAAMVEELDRQFPDRQQFNLSRLFVGAEGTLGIITEATVHLVPLPAARTVVVLLFTTIEQALTAVPRILSCEPSAVELLDRNIVELSRQNLKYRSALDFVTGTPEALLIVEFSGDRDELLQDQVQLLDQKLRGISGLEQTIHATSAEHRDALWNCRKAGAPLLLGIPGARKPIAFVEDTAVDPARLPEFTRRFRDILHRHQLDGAYYGHASVGCLHIRPMIDTKSAADLTHLKQVSDEVAQLVLEFGGAMSGEHGDGLARSYHNLKLFGPQLFAAFQQIKKLFDPAGLMNPGKITASPSPIESLRYGPAYPGSSRPAVLDFSLEERRMGAPQQRLLAAAELCNGAGVCRKTLTGTMCPSFMVTREEEHSPRGRSNALRLALTGQLDGLQLTSRRMYDVLDLCLLCKGCKAECPSNVDVAKMKMEFLQEYHTAHGTPIVARVMSAISLLNRWGSLTAGIANRMSRWSPLRWLLESLTGIDRRRSLPQFAAANFNDWFAAHRPQAQAGQKGSVLLLNDCLTSYCEPQINQAAVELLERLGYRVELAQLECCGRPHLSKGLLHEAKHLAQRNLQRLTAALDRGCEIVGTEPSCLLTLVDEYPDLVPSPEAERVRAHTHLADEFLLRPEHRAELQSLLQPLHHDGNPQSTTAAGTRLSPAAAQAIQLATPQKPALLHGHCQQKALRGTKATTALLQLIPGIAVSEVDSGCCGMAGSFGYDHFDISQKIGERALFPAVRAHCDSRTHGPLIAPGFSCRHQIADGTGQTAQHPIELLWQSVQAARGRPDPGRTDLV